MRWYGVVCATLAVTFWLPFGAMGGVQVINDVPSYEWYHGCGPTAAGMIIGYWDAHGYDNLITAGDGTNSWATNQQAVKDMIASAGHIYDYVPTPDRTPTVGDPYHADDSVVVHGALRVVH